MTSYLRVVSLILLAALQMRCSVLFKDAPKACQSTADCLAKRPDLDLVCVDGLCLANDDTDAASSEWGCVSLPPRTIEANVFHVLHTRVVGVDKQPIAGVAVRLCSGLDVGCQYNPADPNTSKMSDAAGDVRFVVADGFSGFMLYEKAEYLSGILMVSDMNAATVRRYAEDEANPQVAGFNLFKPGDVSLLASLVGVTFDETLALINFRVANCRRESAAGVRALLDRPGSKTTEFYLVNGLPSATVGATDVGGTGGFINMPPGIARLSIRTIGETTDLGSVTAVNRPGHFTSVAFIPGYRPDLDSSFGTE